LPKDLPLWGTVAYYFYRWKRSEKWRKILAALTAEERKRQGYSLEPPAVIINSQSVKTTEKRRVKGDDAVKKIRGRKRLIAYHRAVGAFGEYEGRSGWRGVDTTFVAKASRGAGGICR